jgi:hypothetical protein
MRAGTGRVRSLAAVPVSSGERRIPRTEATCPRGPPRGVGIRASVRRLATPSVAGVCGSVYYAKISVITAALTGCSRRR